MKKRPEIKRSEGIPSFFIFFSLLHTTKGSPIQRGREGGKIRASKSNSGSGDLISSCFPVPDKRYGVGISDGVSEQRVSKKVKSESRLQGTSGTGRVFGFSFFRRVPVSSLLEPCSFLRR